MDESQLQHLYERIISQEVYPDGVCSTERNLVRFVTGSLCAAERKSMEDHLSECQNCRQAVSRLQAASEWFKTNRAQMFQGVIENAAAAKLQPWAHCPSREILEKHVTGAIPDTQAGAMFRERMSAHLAGCATCRQAADAERSSVADRVIIKLEELGRKVSEAVVAGVREMLFGIQLAAVARGAGGMVRAMPGYRSRPRSSIPAVLLDPDGKVTFDDQGQPRATQFDVVRAVIEHDGHFVLDLVTADQTVWERQDSAYLASAALRHENRKLIFPAEKIGPDGRVTIVGNLVSGVEISSLPLSAVELSVVPAGTDS